MCSTVLNNYRIENMFFSSWIDSFSSFWSQSNALQLCNTDDACWNFSRLSFNFKHLFYFFLLISQSQQRWQLLAKKSRQISANLCSCLSIQPAAIKMEAGGMEYEICETGTWLSAGWGQYFSWWIRCSLIPSVWWSWLCQHSFDTVVSLLWAWQNAY